MCTLEDEIEHRARTSHVQSVEMLTRECVYSTFWRSGTWSRRANSRNIRPSSSEVRLVSIRQFRMERLSPTVELTMVDGKQSFLAFVHFLSMLRIDTGVVEELRRGK